MEERWDPEGNDPKVVALLEAFLVYLEDILTLTQEETIIRNVTLNSFQGLYFSCDERC